MQSPVIKPMIASLINVYERLKALDKAYGTNTIRSSNEHSDLPVPLTWEYIEVVCKDTLESDYGTTPTCRVCVYDSKLFLSIGSFAKIFLAHNESADIDALLSNITNRSESLYIEKNNDESLKLFNSNGVSVNFTKYNKFLIGCQYRLELDSPEDICSIIFKSNNTFEMDLRKCHHMSVIWENYNVTCDSNIIDQLPNCCPDIGGRSKLRVKEEGQKYVFSCEVPRFEFFVFKTDTRA